MSRARIFEVCRQNLLLNARRPLFWIWILIVGMCALEFSWGEMRIESGDTAVGGTKVFITSQFAMAMILGALVGMIYPFFIAVASGMTVIHDEEQKVSELLHSTPLLPSEYVLGKALAVLVTIGGVLLAHVGLSILFNHSGLDAEAAEYIGPFALGNYLVPALMFGLPMLLFIAGVSFAVGELTRKPILVFFLPVEANRQLGFDVIGMTNLGEAKLAREAEMSLATLAMITDYDCWKVEEEPVSAEAVIGHVRANADAAKRILAEAIPHIPTVAEWPEHSALDGALMTARKDWPEKTAAELAPLLERFCNA